ncbi:hypothetical protein A4244_03605 [Bacillus badius]|nr:hypothetical protein A4244_03605 [Bacillus badius]OCS86160.1 hypothetical protein A6M11_03600 [Bacillus badius]OVE52379.1 hypothetical protein B1A98_08285 [Bacillus badius]
MLFHPFVLTSKFMKNEPLVLKKAAFLFPVASYNLLFKFLVLINQVITHFNQPFYVKFRM